MLNLDKKIRREVANRGITFKFLAGQIEVTEAGLSKMLKNNSMKVDTLEKISEVLGVDPGYWFQQEETKAPKTAIGTGNVAGDMNKQKVSIGTKSATQTTGMTLDDLMVELKLCVSERESLRTALDLTKSLLASRKELIAELRSK